ncbi:MAG TPA: DUF4215 domain-containing protein [Kofleriaceae bacterium]|nr:DUF4215 domain-containing protein [Kofleriaceae bacterium]
MTRFSQLSFSAIVVAWIGCSPQVEDAAPASPTASDGRLQVTFHLGNGAPAGGFAAKGDVHLRTELAAEEQPFGGGDLAFTVVDARGVELSRDALDCRRLRVERGTGRIVEVHAGYDRDLTPCRHGWSVSEDGSLLVQVAPFADPAPNASGVAALTVMVARVEHLLGGTFPPDSDRGTVLIEVTPENVCGDGQIDGNEECDDGNTTTGDGCSSDCKVEHVCCCGDGVVNPGEDCDDGNIINGDGCSSNCKIEYLP